MSKKILVCFFLQLFHSRAPDRFNPPPLPNSPRKCQPVFIFFLFEQPELRSVLNEKYCCHNSQVQPDTVRCSQVQQDDTGAAVDAVGEIGADDGYVADDAVDADDANGSG